MKIFGINFISSSLILDCCYFITPFAILVTSSRTAIVGFLGALITLIIMNAKFFRNTWRPIILILCGFILTLIVIPKLPKFHDQHVYGSVIEAKLIEPILYPFNSIQSNQFDEFNKKKVIDDSTMSRLLLWRAILQELVDKPDLLLMGIGLGQSHTSFKYMMANGQLNAKIFGNDIISPHNSFIELFYEGGIFCLCALIIFIASRLFNRDNLRSPWFYALIMTFLMMLFFDMLRMRFFWIMLALVEVPIFIRKSHVSKISGVSSHLRGVGK